MRFQEVKDKELQLQELWYPKVIFADEPTGNLDSKNSLNVFEIFKSLCEKGTTIIVATHDKELANLTNKIYEVKDGKIQ